MLEESCERKSKQVEALKVELETWPQRLSNTQKQLDIANMKLRGGKINKYILFYSINMAFYHYFNI